MLRWRRARNLRVRPGGKEPDNEPAFYGALSGAVTAADAGERIVGYALQHILLSRVRLCSDDVFYELDRMGGIVEDCIGVKAHSAPSFSSRLR